MNDITDLLDLEDSNLNVTDVTLSGNKKIVILETLPTIHHCPICNYRMYSRRIKTRTINHPILQDTYQLIIKLKQRRWRCTNQICGYEANETFNFVNKHRRTSNATDLLIVNSFRNLSNTAVKIAETFKTSDTHVLDVFDSYVKMKRLPLSDAICITKYILIWIPSANTPWRFRTSMQDRLLICSIQEEVNLPIRILLQYQKRHVS